MAIREERAGGLIPALVMELRFDRGTILLTDPPSELNLAEAPGILWDARVHAHRAPASNYSALKRWPLGGGARFQDLAPPPRPAEEAWSDVDLRPYQEAALSAWELGHRRGVVALPTGSGKTRLALAAMHRTGLSALCLVPTRVLLDQWLREIGGVYRGAVGCYGDGVRQLAPLTVATFESAYRHMDHLGDRFRLIIVDEVHHFGGGLRDEALEMTVADARLGLTATPPRDPSTANRLAELVGPTVFQLAIADLAGGFLASFDVITLYLDLAPEERAAYASLAAVFTGAYADFHRMAPDARWRDFACHAARTAEGRRALSAWRQMRRLLFFTYAKRRALASLLGRHRYSRVLIFTADNETAYAIARELALRCNLTLVQALLFRATMVKIEVEGNTRALVRQAKWRGLICTGIERCGTTDAALEVSGSFALFRNTRLYGRALGELVPLLAWCPRFRLRAECVVRGRRLTLQLGTGDPIFPASAPRRYDSHLEERFAREFRRLAPAWDVSREPEPITAAGTLIFPDFALQHRSNPARRWLLEIVGFWTPDYVARKLTRYRSARLSNLILCIDEDRNCAEADLPSRALVVRFRRRVDAAAVLRVIDTVRPGDTAPRVRLPEGRDAG